MLRRTFRPKRKEEAGGWRRQTMRSFITRTLQTYYSGDHIKEDEMGGTCSTDGRDEKL